MENLPKRPTWNDEMLDELSTVVGKLVFDWCDDDTDLEDCVESAKKVLEFNSNSNGYELAKEFEDEGFSSDSELVDILDGVWYEKHKIIEKAVKDWVSINNLKLEYEVGDKVIAKFHKSQGGDIECEVVQLYPETMQYGLWHENHSSPKGKGHVIVEFERVSKLGS